MKNFFRNVLITFVSLFLLGGVTFAQSNSLGGFGNQLSGLWQEVSSTALELIGSYTTINIEQLCDETGSNCSDVSAGLGVGDVTKVGTPVDNQIGVWTGDGTIEGTTDFTFDGQDLVFYDATNDGNPELRMGVDNTDELHIQTVYNSGTQVIDYVLFQTDVDGGGANGGQYKFNVDGVEIFQIADDGVNIESGFSYDINGAAS